MVSFCHFDLLVLCPKYFDDEDMAYSVMRILALMRAWHSPHSRSFYYGMQGMRKKKFCRQFVANLNRIQWNLELRTQFVPGDGSTFELNVPIRNNVN
jgi:hypothetical protein